MENSAWRISNRLAIGYWRGEYKNQQKGHGYRYFGCGRGNRAEICIQFYLSLFSYNCYSNQNLFSEFLLIVPIVILVSIKGYYLSLPTCLSTANKHEA